MAKIKIPHGTRIYSSDTNKVEIKMQPAERYWMKTKGRTIEDQGPMSYRGMPSGPMSYKSNEKKFNAAKKKAMRSIKTY